MMEKQSFKGSQDPSHELFEIKIRHGTTMNFKVDLEILRKIE